MYILMDENYDGLHFVIFIFIFSENQFFISIAGDSVDVTNCLGKALYERIIVAHESV